MIRLMVLSLLVATLATTGRTQTSRPAVDESRVRELVRALDARDFETREDAIRELRALGAGVRPLIVKLKDEASVEARIRLDNLLEDLGGSGADIDVELKTRTVDILLEQATIADALELLERKTGFSFAPSAELDPRRIVDLELRKVSPFAALDAFSEVIGQRWTQDYGSGQIRFYRSAPGSTPVVSYLGPFRFSLDSVNLNSSLVFGGEVRSNCYLQGRIDIEPRADVLGVFLQPELVEVRDDQGRDLVPDAPHSTAFQPAGARRNFHFNLRFDQPSPGAETLASVKARLQVVVPKRYDDLTLPIGQDPDLRVETVDSVLKFRSQQAVGPNRRIELRIDRRVPKTGGDRPVEVPYETIEVTTAEGALLLPLGPVQRIKSEGYEILRFDVSGTGGELRSIFLRSLVAIDSRAVEIEFSDVPLP